MYKSIKQSHMGYKLPYESYICYLVAWLYMYQWSILLRAGCLSTGVIRKYIQKTTQVQQLW